MDEVWRAGSQGREEGKEKSRLEEDTGKYTPEQVDKVKTTRPVWRRKKKVDVEKV